MNRQVWILRHGKPEVLEVRQTPDPLPQPGEVRIRVEYSGVNFAGIGTGTSFAQTPSTHQHSFGGAEHWAQVFDDPARDE